MNSEDISIEQDDYTDITLRSVEGYGILPIVSADDKEVWRGQFFDSYDNALASAHKFLCSSVYGTTWFTFIKERKS